MKKISLGVSLVKWGVVILACCEMVSARGQTTATNRPPAPRRPNVVLIIADNIGYGDLGSYGQARVKTPRLDQLASEGMRFTSYYTADPQDAAARASLFTGLEPRHVGSSFSHALPIDALTLPIFLKEAGFHTGLMGLWNLGDTPSVQPNTKGFEEFAGFLSDSHARDYFTENIYRQDTLTGSNRLETLPENLGNGRGRYTPDLLGEAGVNYMRIRLPDKFNHYTPFFLCLAYPIPHNTTPPKSSPYDDETWPQPAKDRAAMISHMDASIGRVMDTLERLGQNTNTIVIFTSIGGPQLEGAMDPKFFKSSGALRGQAGSVYEGGIRVPLIIRWPAQIKPGQVSDFACAAWDILPTVMEVAFMKPPPRTDGISLLPVLTQKGKTNAHENFYWETTVDDVKTQAARQGDWKAVRAGTNAPALYDLKTDLGETNNVAAKNPDVVKRLKAVLGGAQK